MVRNEDMILHLVGAIHAAAADPDPAAWPRALGRLGDALGGAGTVVADHVLPTTVVDLVSAQVAPEVPAFVLGRLHKLCLWRPAEAA